MQIITHLFFELVSYFINRKVDESEKNQWGIALILMGVILTGFGAFLLISSLLSGSVVPVMWIAIGPFLIIGIPGLLLGIVILNNPEILD